MEINLNDLELIETEKWFNKKGELSSQWFLFELYATPYQVTIDFCSKCRSWRITTDGLTFEDRRLEESLEFDLDYALEHDDDEDAESISIILGQLDNMRAENYHIIEHLLILPKPAQNKV